ncbi:MAG: low molecular weight phosphotyrosine protein phosphatase [Pseudomonadota bacterium]
MAETRPSRLLFVCTGNICRSPMAEYLARAYATERGRAVEVRSASAMGLDGHPAHPNVTKVMAEIGIDTSAHRSQPLTPELLRWADWTLVMELAHARACRELEPACEERVLLLGSFCGQLEIADPLGGWKGRFRRTRDELEDCVQRFMDRLPPQPAQGP